MKRTQLAAAILMAGGLCSNAIAATYSVTPLPLQDTAKSNFARSIDNSGKMLSTVTTEYNPPVDVERLENYTTFFTNENYPLESEEDVRQGIFSDSDYTAIYNYLIANRYTQRNQQLANARTYITDTVDARLVPGLDEITEQFDDYTNSVVTLAHDSLNGDYIVGTSEGVTIEETFEDEEGKIDVFTYRKYGERAFVEVNGESKGLLPENDLLGGLSYAFAINDNLQVAGFSTVSYQEQVFDEIEECENVEEPTEPEAYCKSKIYEPQADLFRRSVKHATIWQLDANGDVIERITYPLVFTPEEDDVNPYAAQAYDINNLGIAVGESPTGEVVEILRPGASRQNREAERVATIYRNGQTEEFLPRDENLQSVAFSINDNNWVTGYVLRAISSTARQQLFVHNLDTGESRYPQSFFIGADVDANAINNNDIVVGKADVESGPDASREAHAFMYNIATEEFIDLNDLTPCDSPYTLVEAVDINDNNEIIANARIRGARRYITGTEILDTAGEVIEEDIIVAVKLTPQANGEVEQCDTEEDQGYERQGASMSAWWLLLLGVAGFRRRR